MITPEEPLLIERSQPGNRAVRMPELDVPFDGLESVLPAESLRKNPPKLPEVTEVDLARHYTRLSQKNFSVDTHFYPLGSCTMKYNPKLNEKFVGHPAIRRVHPYQADAGIQPLLRMLFEMQEMLTVISGFPAVSLQPSAGAQGELACLMMFKAYHRDRGDFARDQMLVPDSAHGTNPATAAIVGYAVENIRSNAQGGVDLEALRKAVSEDVAALMITNPNTLGIFEHNITAIAEILHEKGAQLYMDGANMNALLAKVRPGDCGADVMHLNLHKTFSTPHGGGGPGAGPVCVKTHLAPFLPLPVVEEQADGSLRLDYDRPDSIGRVRAYVGNFGVLVRALAYIMANGGNGLKAVTEDAVLNSNYIRKGLENCYDLPYRQPSLHECVLSDRLQALHGVRTGDIAKRLIDYGFHPYTVSFPLIVHGALMIEPTETESKQELDLFIDAMREIAREAEQEPKTVLSAPHTTRVGRLDEVAAARKPILRWKPEAAPAAGPAKTSGAR